MSTTRLSFLLNPHPQGILHTTGGYMLGAATSFKYTFDTQTDDHNDVFFCTAGRAA